MKNYAIALVCLLIASSCSANIFNGDWNDTLFGDSCCYLEETHSRSFMITRSIANNLCVNNNWWLDILYNKKGPLLSGAQIIAAYQHSMPDEKTARYFLFKSKNNILVSGSGNTSDTLTRDIMAEWIGLGTLTNDPTKRAANTFRGGFTLNPVQQQMGILFEYKKDLRGVFEWSFFDDSWVGVFAPITVVSNNLQLCEFDVINRPTTGPHDIIEAMDQPSWAYNRIAGQRSTLRLSDLQFKFGKAFLFQDHFILGYYSLISFPTGNRQNPGYLFDAVAGNNGHLAFGSGVNMQIPLNRDLSSYAISLFVDLEAQFLLHNTQFRTVDLRGKPWSRYMQFVRNDSPVNATIPGVNVLTVEVLVHPYSIVDFSGGLRITSEPIEFEIGYDIWGHPQEYLYLRCPFPEDRYGIASGNEAPTVAGTAPTASQSTIKTLAPVDVDGDDNPTFVSIKQGDLDLQSGAAQSTLNQKIHASISFLHIGKNRDGFINIGAFYDVPYRNTALTNGAVWIKFGTSF